MNVLLLVAAMLGADPVPEPVPSDDPKVVADRLVAEGAALGQKGDWDGAIAAFEKADEHFPRAIHACNIGLAHARANRPEKALMNLTACQARATEPLPAWVGKRTTEARTALSKGAYAPLELVSSTPGVKVTLSHYGPTAFTPPVTVWLPLGDVQLNATAPNKKPLDETLTVASKAALRRVVTLEDVPVIVPAPDPIEPDPDPIEPDPQPIRPDPVKAPPSKTPAYVTIAVGSAAIVTGAIFYGVALGTKADAEDLSGDRFDDALATFETQRALALGFLIGGGLVTAGGIVWALVLDEDEPAVSVTPIVGPETGLVGTVRF